MPVINGNRSQDNVYMLDGMTNMYMERKSSNLYPNPDAIEAVGGPACGQNIQMR
jgi:hypothetical protein